MSLFITFEGSDGVGKSTQIERLASFLSAEAIPMLITREPGGTPIGEKIREIILDRANSEMQDVTEMLLYAASRAQLVREVIKPALSEGKVVICDRFLDSSLVYQGFGRRLGGSVTQVNEPAVDGLTPDLTLLLLLDTEAAEGRRHSRATDRIEAEGIRLQDAVHDAYEELAAANKHRIIAIDASRGIDEIADEIREHVKAAYDRLG